MSCQVTCSSVPVWEVAKVKFVPALSDSVSTMEVRSPVHEHFSFDISFHELPFSHPVVGSLLHSVNSLSLSALSQKSSLENFCHGHIGSMLQRVSRALSWFDNECLRKSPLKTLLKILSNIYEERKWRLKRLRHELKVKKPKLKLLSVTLWPNPGKCPQYHQEMRETI